MLLELTTSTIQLFAISPSNVAHIRESRPDSGRGIQVKVLKTFKVVSSSQAEFRFNS